jgi:hypothetical protein
MPAKIMYKVHPHGTPTLYTEVGPTFSVAGYKISKGVVGKLFGTNQKQNLQTMTRHKQVPCVWRMLVPGPVDQVCYMSLQ